MKIKIIARFLILISFNSYSQEDEWNNYDLDSIASIDMPFEVYEIDTIIDYNKVYQMYSEKKTAKFIAKKIYVGKRYSNIETLKLPNNKKGLNKFYFQIIDFFDQIIKTDFEYKKKIKKNGLEGYEISYVNKEKTKVHQIQLFYINKNLYIFSYIKENGLSELDRNIFFDSIFFDDQKELLQYPKMSLGKKLMISLLILLFLSFVYRFKPKRKKLLN